MPWAKTCRLRQHHLIEVRVQHAIHVVPELRPAANRLLGLRVQRHELLTLELHHQFRAFTAGLDVHHELFTL